eukprot:924042-Prymnesium_polylepis.3
MNEHRSGNRPGCRRSLPETLKTRLRSPPGAVQPRAAPKSCDRAGCASRTRRCSAASTDDQRAGTA